jgi:hypothetical protein
MAHSRAEKRTDETCRQIQLGQDVVEIVPETASTHEKLDIVQEVDLLT